MVQVVFQKLSLKDCIMAAYPPFADYEYPNCDLCGSPADELHRRMSIEDAKGTKMNLVECTDCGLRFFSPRPPWKFVGPMVADEKEQAQRLFDTGSFLPVQDIAVQKANIQSYYTKMLEDATRILGHIPQSMFEVGGLVGWFAVAASKFGIPLIHGCDLNPHGVRLANEQGIPFVACDFADYEPSQQYELVVALDYLEHTYRPWQDLQKLAGMIAPGGIFLAKTFLDELDTEREMLAPPTHAIHWTTPVLRSAIERAGLMVRQWLPGYKGWMPEIIAQKE